MPPPQRHQGGENPQIHSRDYAAELRAAGCKEILAIAIAFQGKDYLLRHEATAAASRR